jgi:hypothetical protein
LATTRAQLEDALTDVATERAKGLAEVAKQKADLSREIEAMQVHAVQQEGHIELNIGGHRFETSVQTLRHVLHTFFDAYFSGRYAQDVCGDGSIFVDRDGEHFGHVLEFMRNGVVSVAGPGAQPSVPLLRALKREFGFYCIELVAEVPLEPAQLETAYVVGGANDGENYVLSIERYDASSGQWSTMTTINAAEDSLGACVIAGELYVTGGANSDVNGGGDLSSDVKKYSPSTKAGIES